MIWLKKSPQGVKQQSLTH